MWNFSKNLGKVFLLSDSMHCWLKTKQQRIESFSILYFFGLHMDLRKKSDTFITIFQVFITFYATKNFFSYLWPLWNQKRIWVVSRREILQENFSLQGVDDLFWNKRDSRLSNVFLTCGALTAVFSAVHFLVLYSFTTVMEKQNVNSISA